MPPDFSDVDSWFKQLFELSPDPTWIIDDNRFVACNEAAVKTLGYSSRAEFLNVHPSKLSPPRQPDGEDSYGKAERMMAIAKDRGLHRFEWIHAKADGTNFVAEITLSAIELQSQQVIYCVWRDISERKIADAKIQRLSQLYAALGQCNQAIVRCASEKELLPKICQVAVQFGGMKMAWVGLIDPGTRMVRPVASYGAAADEYLQDIGISIDADNSLGRGPTGIAVRENQPVWCQDFLNDPRTARWHERGAHVGWRASAALPLHRNGTPIGVLNLYASEVGAFDEPARGLLTEMVADINFALDNFSHESQRRHTEEEIQFKNTILQTLHETSLDAMLVVDEKAQIVSYNQQFIDMWHLPPPLVSAGLDRPVLQLVVNQVKDPEAFLARVHYLTEQRDEKSREEIQLKDGRIIDRYSAPVVDANCKYYGRVWYFRDVTEREKADHALRTSEERFKTMFVQAPMGIALIDSLNGRIHEANPRFAEIAGRPMDEIASIDWLSITHPDDMQADLDNMALMNAGRIGGFQMEKRFLRPDGTVVWIDMAIAPLTIGQKTHPRHLCMIQDITDRKAAQLTIAHLSRVNSVLSGINSLIVRVQDRDELFRGACQIAVETGGFRMAMIAIVDRSTMRIVPVASAGKDVELLTAIKDILSSTDSARTTMTARAIREKRAVLSNDSYDDPQVLFNKMYAEAGVRSMAVLPLIVSDEAIGVIALYAREIQFFQEEEMALLTELAGDVAFAIDHIAKQERLDYLAYYDVLTGLANRKLFFERTGQYMRSAVSGGHKLALFLMDLERFKNINDSLGRVAGDTLLRQVAEWLTHINGDTGQLARIDADHFAMVMPEVSQDSDLARLVEKMLTAFLGHPFQLHDTVFRIAAKVGIALFPDDGEDADTLFRNAEAALKKAKATGERYLFYTQKMTEAVAGKLTLENQLRNALDNEEFVIHYQPKVSLVSAKITSAEALIRWNDPRTGLVPPGRFIPILEETGLIYEVGRWALRQTIKDYLRWCASGLPAVRLAVNVSPLQLRNRDFVSEIEKVIGIDARAPAGLELEITESLIMQDIKHNIATLEAIQAMDVTITIDDFGTGFSSLSYLSRLPIDMLKIDRSFVMAMTVAPEGLSLVSTIINLAHSLQLKVIAEGVENEEQSRLLRLLNCDEMQGFLFSEPVPVEVFEERFLIPPPAVA